MGSNQQIESIYRHKIGWVHLGVKYREEFQNLEDRRISSIKQEGERPELRGKSRTGYYLRRQVKEQGTKREWSTVLKLENAKMVSNAVLNFEKSIHVCSKSNYQNVLACKEPEIFKALKSKTR